jgi:hypothetical protein
MPAFLAFWQQFDLGVDDGRFEGVFDEDDDMPSRYEKAQRHTLRALRRYAAKQFTADEIVAEALAFPDDPRFWDKQSRHLIAHNLALALSTPCPDFEELVKYAAKLNDHAYITRQDFQTMQAHVGVDFFYLTLQLSNETQAFFSSMAGYNKTMFFQDVWLRDDVELLKHCMPIIDVNSVFDLESMLAKLPCNMDSNTRRWHNPDRKISSYEFFLRLEAQLGKFSDSGMTNDDGHLEWLDATDDAVDDLPGYEQHMADLSSDIVKLIYTAILRIDEVFPKPMHRVFESLMNEVSQHIDLREHYLTFIGKNPGWILMAKKRPDYESLFLTEALGIDALKKTYNQISFGYMKALEITLRNIGLSKVEKVLRNQPELLLIAYKVTGHDPLIESMSESDRAQALEIDMGL